MIWKGKITGQGPFWKRWLIGYNLVNFRSRKSRKDDWLAIIWLTSVREYFTRFSKRVIMHYRWKLYYFGLCTTSTALITAGGLNRIDHVYCNINDAKMERPKGLFDPTPIEITEEGIKAETEKNYEWVRVCAFKCVCTCHLELRIVCARVDMQKIKCNILSRWNKHSTYATNSKKVWKDWHAYFAETNEKKPLILNLTAKNPTGNIVYSWVEWTENLCEKTFVLYSVYYSCSPEEH